MSTLTHSVRRITPSASVLLLAAAGAWVAVIVLAERMGQMPGTMGLDVGSFVAVWALMMTAMMLPSVTPFASLYTRTFTDHPGRRLSALVLGYLLVWTLAAIPAFVLAWIADRAVAGDAAVGTALAVAIFAACGIYQLTPIKDRCLVRCRTPLGSLVRLASLRGRLRDVRAGLYHGAFCLGCCWALMAMLVAFGLMNVAAMVLLAAVVLVEKAWPRGKLVSQLIGVLALGLAVAVVFQPHLAPGLLQSRHGMGTMSP